MKICTKCNIEKRLEQFYTMKTGKHGRASRCIDCTNSYMRNRYKNQFGVREKHLERHRFLRETSEEYRNKTKLHNRKLYSSISGRAATLWNNARKSPAGKTLEFSVTINHIRRLIEIGICPCTGIAFQLDDTHQKLSGRKKNPYSPSIDRINSRLGYTNENVRIVIWQYNLMKGELTDEELRVLCRYVLEKS